MRASARLTVASLLAVLGSATAAADPSLGARALTERVLVLTEQVAALQTDNARLQQAVQTLSGHVSVLLAASAALDSTLACVAPDSGAGRFVLRGCDLAVERTGDGSDMYGNVEINGALSVNEVNALVVDGDPRSGKLSIVGEESVLLRSGSGSQLIRKDGDVRVDGRDVSVIASRDVDIKAGARIVLQAAEIIEN
jgi:hypothetical protein